MTIEVGAFRIFGLPPYFFFSMLGFSFSYSCYMFLLLKSNITISKKHLFLCMISILGVVLGARLFGCLTNIAIALYNKEKIGFNVIYKAGLVYYGGLLGGILFHWIGLRILFKNIDEHKMLNPYAISIPLFHFFGRLGCLFAGCCYGKEYNGFCHIIYLRDNIFTETFPIQFVESAMELCIFCFMIIWFCFNKKVHNKNMLVFYLIIYSLGRFFIEFFRGDSTRGYFGYLSFSQIISIILFMFNIIYLLKVKLKHGNN